MKEQLFQSMVSIRTDKNKSTQPHLGLGLYIVKLIADFHGGEVWAENTGSGVKISLRLPRNQSG